MKKLLFLLPLYLLATEPFYLWVDPPKEWLISDPSKYEKGIIATFISSKRKIFTPSVSLATEKIGDASIEEYTTALEKIYKRDLFQKLGTFQTDAGVAHLFQIDRKSQWGEIRLLQAITLYNGFALIQTAVSLKKNYLDYHQTFLDTFKTLRTTPPFTQMCDRPELKSKIEDLTKCWKKLCSTSKDSKETLFFSPFFQNNQWKPFANFIEEELDSKGKCWKFLALKQIQETLLSENTP